MIDLGCQPDRVWDQRKPKLLDSPGRDFLNQIVWSWETQPTCEHHVSGGRPHKRMWKKETCFLMHFPMVTLSTCCCCVSLLILEPTGLAFQYRVKSRNYPGIHQTIGDRLRLLRQLTTGTGNYCGFSTSPGRDGYWTAFQTTFS